MGPHHSRERGAGLDARSSARPQRADSPSMTKEWNTSKWPRRQPPEDPGDFDDGSPDGLVLRGDDLLEQNRHREYVRGRRYEVFVPSPFARNRTAKSKAEPVLRERYFVRWEMRDGEHWPVFATEDEWHEIRLREKTDPLQAEGYRAPEQWMTLKEIAAEVGKDVRTIRRHIVQRGECPFTAFGRTKKVRRSDFEEWTKKDRPETRETREADSYRKKDF